MSHHLKCRIFLTEETFNVAKCYGNMCPSSKVRRPQVGYNFGWIFQVSQLQRRFSNSPLLLRGVIKIQGVDRGKCTLKNMVLCVSGCQNVAGIRICSNTDCWALLPGFLPQWVQSMTGEFAFPSSPVMLVLQLG